MSQPDYAGYWTGTFEGTNRGGMTADIRQEGAVLTGTASFSEPDLGQYEYAFAGVSSDPLSLSMTPSRTRGVVELGKLQIVGSLSEQDTLTGRWKSTIGTEGIFSMKRATNAALASTLPQKNSVFVVHGHDEAAMHAVARFLERIGVQPVILHEQISRGMTVLEKFEEYAERAGFAVIIMTPDDYGYPINHDDKRKARARQNVVLELGYFAAKLGRQKTFVLMKGDIEMPSDVLGIVYEALDSKDGWKLALAKALKSDGFAIDMNLLLS